MQTPITMLCHLSHSEIILDSSLQTLNFQLNEEILGKWRGRANGYGMQYIEVLPVRSYCVDDFH